MQKNNTIKHSVLIFFISSQTHALQVEPQTTIMQRPSEVSHESEWRPHVGVFLTASNPEGSGSQASEYAVDVGYQPYIPIGIAAEISQTRVDSGFEKNTRTIIWGKGTYHLSGNIPVVKDSYFGFALGTAYQSNSTALAFAPLAGFDIPLSKSFTNTKSDVFSLGASARYVYVGNDLTDTFSLSGVMKYWF